MRYKDAAAFRMALAQNLRNRHPDEDVSRLLKRAMMERFLARTATTLSGTVLLKGGYAMELRLEQARATQDVDLTMQGTPAAEAVEVLRDAAETDLGDFLSFLIEETTAAVPDAAPYGGKRLTVIPRLGGKPFMPFPLDVGVGDAVTGVDVLRGGIDFSFANLPPVEVAAVPVEVHLAEKLHALSLRRARHRPNSRIKDLVDVMLLLKRGLPETTVVRAAVDATFERRGTHELPERLELPLDAWALEYTRFSNELDLAPVAPTVEDADARLQALIVDLRT